MPLLLLLGQTAAIQTVGGTVQLGGFSSSGGVATGNTVGGTAQIAAFSSTGGVNSFNPVGGTVQLGSFSSTGGVASSNTVGGTVQIAGFTSTGGVLAPPDTATIGGTVQLGPFTSTGGIQVGDSVGAGGTPNRLKKKQDQKEYEKAYKAAKYRKEQREAILAAVEAEQTKGKPKLTLKKKRLTKPDISQQEIKQLADIELEVDRLLAIEYQLQYLEFKRKENEALAILLLIA